MKTRIRQFVGLVVVVIGLVFVTPAFATGTGWWIGDVGGTPKFSIGNPSGNYMTWDGTTLKVSATNISPITTLTAGFGYCNQDGSNLNTLVVTGSGPTSLGVICGAAINNGTGGQIITIANRVSSGTLTLQYDAAGDNRFIAPGGANIVLNPGGSVIAQYQTSPGIGAWYVVTCSGAASGC
jgi:hypothetical protein